MKWVKTLWTCSIVHFHHIIPINRYLPIITNVYINNSYILETLPIFHLPAVRTWFGQDHGFILDGCYANILSKSGISICRWHLVTHRKSRQIRFFLKDIFYFICAHHILSYHLLKVPWARHILTIKDEQLVQAWFCFSTNWKYL